MTTVIVGALLAVGCALVALFAIFALFVMIGRFADGRLDRRRQRAVLAVSVDAIRARQNRATMAR